MTIEEKAKAYDNVVNKLRRFMEHGIDPLITRTDVQDFFPELAESEDERIRKSIIAIINNYVDNSNTFKPKMIAWLEKQVEKPQGKSALEAAKEEKSPVESLGISPEEYEEMINECIYGFDYKNANIQQKDFASKIEPKFKIGDWVVQGRNILKIRCVGAEYYCFETVGGYIDNMLVSEIDSLYHPWTIDDAKDGDVLTTIHDNGIGQITFIFKRIVDDEMFCYCLYDSEMSDKLCFDPCTDSDFIGCVSGAEEEFHPATKEQRDILMKAIADAGYIFDFDKKELRKIDQSELTEFEDAVKDMMNAYRDAIGANDVTTEEIKKHAKYLLSLIPHKPIEQKLSNSEKIGKNEKPMWTDEDEKRLQSCIIELQGKGLMGGVDTIDTKWLKSLKQRMEEQ